MGETITVCESICRDFSWIWFADPRTKQGFFQFLASAVVAFSGLYIAKVVYVHQKQIDRENEILSEARSAYVDFIAVINAYYLACIQKEADAMARVPEQLHVSASRLICFASPAVALSARGLINALQEYRLHTRRLINYERLVKETDPETVSDKVIKARRDKLKACSADRPRLKSRCDVERVRFLAAVRRDLFPQGTVEAEQAISAFFPDAYSKLEGED